MPTAPSPDFTFPASQNTVSVKLFNSFRNGKIGSAPVLSAAPGSTADEASVLLSCSGKSFLLEHSSGQKIVFDLGIRKDVSTMAKLYKDLIESGMLVVDFGPDVAETLTADGVDLKSINAVIWSHSHFDHTGNPSTFPSTTKLVIGAGTQKACRPGYPLNENATLPESDFLGREVVEIEFPEDAPVINGLKSHDYFGDGSFYLLEAPGHCIGHMVGLARTTPTTFILFGADVAHHPAMLHPTQTYPLPDDLKSKVPKQLSNCPCDWPFLALPKKEGSIHDDHDVATVTYHRLLEFDAHPDVFVVISHDCSLEGKDGKGDGVVPWFPETINEWKDKGVKEAVRWLYLEPGNPAFRW